MSTSQNGYPVLTAAQTVVYQVGETHQVRLAPGAPGLMLAHMANWFDDNIRDIDPGILDEWGWASRPIRGSTETSNHASGTAVDVDATKWPLGVEPTRYLDQSEIMRIHTHLVIYEGCIRWGADYTGRKDPMHFEINRPLADVERVWAKIAGGGAPSNPGQVNNVPVASTGPRSLYLTNPHLNGGDVRAVQTKLHNGYPVYRHTLGNLVVDGDFGPITDRWVKEFQRRSGLKVDGIVGPATRRALGL